MGESAGNGPKVVQEILNVLAQEKKGSPLWWVARISIVIMLVGSCSVFVLLVYMVVRNLSD